MKEAVDTGDGGQWPESTWEVYPWIWRGSPKFIVPGPCQSRAWAPGRLQCGSDRVCRDPLTPLFLVPTGRVLEHLSNLSKEVNLDYERSNKFILSMWKARKKTSVFYCLWWLTLNVAYLLCKWGHPVAIEWKYSKQSLTVFMEIQIPITKADDW